MKSARRPTRDVVPWAADEFRHVATADAAVAGAAGRADAASSNSQALSRKPSACSRIKGDNAMKLFRRTFLRLAVGTTVLPIASPVAVLGQGTTIPSGASRIVERTHYYAKPDLAAEVLNVRREASAMRLSIGLPAGEIFVKHPGGDGSEPDVAWQCTFADAAARDADLAARAASAEFESVRVQMRKLYARFERQVFAIALL
jgi:hypothetical protein